MSATLGIPAKFEKRTATGVVMDAFLAAIALEIGATVCTTDRDILAVSRL